MRGVRVRFEACVPYYLHVSYFFPPSLRPLPLCLSSKVGEMSSASEKKPAVHKSGGATFSPRLPDGQRPAYPSLASTLMKTGLEWLRSGVILSFLTYLVHPWYLELVDLLMDPEGPTALDERGVFTLLTCACHTLIYIFWCGGTELLLFLGFWRDYQFERLPRQVPTAKLIAKTLALAAVGQLIVTPLLLYYSAYFNFKRFGMPDLKAPLPDFLTLFRNYTVARVFNDWGFYWAHRIVHTKFLYKAIHKQHHLYTGSIPITAEFASMPEVRSAFGLCLSLNSTDCLVRLVMVVLFLVLLFLGTRLFSPTPSPPSVVLCFSVRALR